MLNSSSAARAQGIQWTRPYLVELCDTIRQALEAWAGESDASAPDLDQARMACSKLAASLETLAASGAAGLAHALRRALDAIESPDSETATVLLESVAVLPDYLERLETGSPDTPEALADFVRRTESIAGLEPDPAENPWHGLSALDDDGAADYQAVDAERLHRGYQRALRDWLNDVTDIKGLEEFTRALWLTPHLQLRRVGKVAQAVFRGLAGGQLKPGPRIQAHLAALDQLLRRLAEEGASEATLAQADKAALDLMSDVRGAAPGCPEIDRINAAGEPEQATDADELERARSVLSGRNRALFTAIADAARGELNRAKDALNEFLLGRETAGPGIGEQAGLLHSVAESFGMLGLDRLRERVHKQADRLGELTADPENPVLLDVARELLLVESELDEAVLYLGEAPESDLLEGDGQHLPKAEHRRVMRQLLGESLDDLGQAKHLLDQIHRGQSEPDGVQQAIRILGRVAGVLHMAGQPIAAEMLEAGATCIAEEMSGDVTGDADRGRLEALADALVVVEFYLDSLTRLDDRGAEYLDDARDRLIRLGYLTGHEEPAEQEASRPADGEVWRAPEPEREVADPGQTAEEIEAVDEAEDEPLSIDFEELHRSDDVAPEPESLSGGDSGDKTEEQGLAEGEPEDQQPLSIEFEARPRPEDAVDAGDRPAAEAPEETTPVEDSKFETDEALEAAGPDAGEEASETQDAVYESDSADFSDGQAETGPSGESALDADDFDLMSIFLEEFDEELTALRERFPRWRDQLGNQALLTDIRRSFHTIKGSGRMTGAERIGEFAWQIEQLLNLTLDGQYAAERVSDIVGEAIEALPSLRAQLVGEPPDLDDSDIDELLQRVESVGRESDLPELEGLDQTLVQLMVKEIKDHLENIDRWIETSQRQGWPADVDRDLIRSVHTIKGTLRLAPIGDEAESMQLIEEYLQEVLDTDGDPTEPAVELMEDLRALLSKRLDRLERRAVSTEHFDTAALASQARALIGTLHHEAGTDEYAQPPDAPVAEEASSEKEIPEGEVPEEEVPEEEVPEEGGPRGRSPRGRSPRGRSPRGGPRGRGPRGRGPRGRGPRGRGPRGRGPRGRGPRGRGPRGRSPRGRSPRGRRPPRKRSPRKRSPRKRSPRKRSPRKRSPRKRSPRKRSPRKRSPRKRSPRKRSPRKRFPKKRPPRKNLPLASRRKKRRCPAGLRKANGSSRQPPLSPIGPKRIHQRPKCRNGRFPNGLTRSRMSPAAKCISRSGPSRRLPIAAGPKLRPRLPSSPGQRTTASRSITPNSMPICSICSWKRVRSCWNIPMICCSSCARIPRIRSL